MRLRTAVLLLSAVTLAACGDSGTEPDENGCFAIIGNHGPINATISGFPAFEGRIPDGNATFTPPASGTPGIFVIQAMDTDTGTSVLVGGPMVVGAHTASVNNVNGQAVQIVVQTRSCTASTGTWTANLALGTATVTVTTQSATGVSGSFTGTLEPGAGTGAVGTKSISGTFNATF